MKIKATLVALLVGCGVATAAPAHADGGPCPMPAVTIAVVAPIIIICGDANNTVTNHTTTVTIDPSLDVSPKLFTPGP